MTDESINLDNTLAEYQNKARKDLFAASDALGPVYGGFSGTVRSTALSEMVNWDLNTSAPAAARENALYVVVCFLTVAVALLAIFVGVKKPT